MPSVSVNAVKSGASIVSQADLQKLHELGPMLVANNDLMTEFKENPETVAQREVGFNVPQGFHLHFIDERNNYFPPEGNASDQLAKELGINRHWGRLEVRAGGGGGPSAAWCIGMCTVCG